MGVALRGALMGASFSGRTEISKISDQGSIPCAPAPIYKAIFIWYGLSIRKSKEGRM